MHSHPLDISYDSERLALARELTNRTLEATTLFTPASGIFRFSPLDPSRAIPATGSNPDAILDKRQWEQFYFELCQGTSAKETMQAPERIDQLAETFGGKGQVPIAIAFFRYHSAHHLFDNLERVVSPSEFVVPSASELRMALREEQAFFATAYLPDRFVDYKRLPEVHYGLSIEFIVPADLYLSNIDPRPVSMRIDFDDGAEPRAVAVNEPVSVVYPRAGKKILKLEATFGQNVLQARFELDVRMGGAPRPSAEWNDLQYRLEVNGKTYSATGHARVFYGTGHSVLTNPFIIAEGFSDGLTLDDLWDMLDAEGFATALLSAGKDLVILRYDDAARHIEANAGVVIACIKKAIAQRQGSARLVIGGASMGGLTTRFALAYLSERGAPEIEEIDTYFSFDTPHNGASVPLAVQFFFTYFAPLNKEARKFKTLIDSPASQEMLLFWVGENSQVVAPSPLRTQFMRNLTSGGSLTQIANRFGVANGSGSGFPNYPPPGIKVLEWDYKWGLASGDLYSSPGTQERSSFWKRVYFVGNQVGKEPSYRGTSDVLPNIDSAPGGTRMFFRQICEALNSTSVQGETDVAWPGACFIPTISALGMSTLSPYRQADLVQDLRASPAPTFFTAYMYSEANTPHVQVTPEIYRWLLERLGITPILDPSVVGIFGVHNPLANNGTEMFAIGSPGHSFWRNHNNGIWWQWWNDYAGLENAPLSSSVFAAANPMNKRVEAFLVGLDGKLYNTFFDVRGWNGWSATRVGLEFTSGNVSRVFAADNPRNKYLEVFLVPQSGMPLYHNVNDGDKWWGWTDERHTKLWFDAKVSNFLVIANPNHNLEAFLVGGDTVLYHNYFDGSWKGWTPHRDGLKFHGATKVVAAVNPRNRHLEVFLIAQDGRLYHNYFDGKWNDWSASRKGLEFKGEIKDMNVTPNLATGNLDAFLVHRSPGRHHLHYNYFDGAWHGWAQDYPGLAFPEVVESVFSITNEVTKALEAFLITNSGALFRTAIRQNHWNGWNYWPIPDPFGDPQKHELRGFCEW